MALKLMTLLVLLQHTLVPMESKLFMLTPDKDYGQLIGPNVFMYRPRHGGGYETLGEKEVEAK